MTSTQQRAALQRQIWKIANDVRGAVDGWDFKQKATNTNVMQDEHIQKVMALCDSKKNVPNVAETVPYEKVVANDYNLSVSTYVEAKDTREVIDITKLNTAIKATVIKIDQLRNDIDAIIAEIEA